MCVCTETGTASYLTCILKREEIAKEKRHALTHSCDFTISLHYGDAFPSPHAGMVRHGETLSDYVTVSCSTTAKQGC